MGRFRKLTILACLGGTGGLLWTQQYSVDATGLSDEGCPTTSDPETHAGTTLQQFTSNSGSTGVSYDDSISKLLLSKAAGNFSAATIPINDSHNASCAGDFDEDGWTDLVVGKSGNKFIYFYKNQTYLEPAPNWNDPNDIRNPNFLLATTIRPSGSGGSHTAMVCGDYNGDGHQDFAYFSAGNSAGTSYGDQKLFLGNGDGTFGPGGNNASSNVVANESTLGIFNWTSRNAATYDYNNDGWMDIVYGTKLTTNNSTGAVLALINTCPDISDGSTPCSVTPIFNAQPIITNQNFGSKGMNAINIADFNDDGYGDLIAGGPNYCAGLKLFPGLPGGGFDVANAQDVAAGSGGGATVILAEDFSLDGIPDIAFGGDGWSGCGSNGGQSRYYQNDGTTTPFSGGQTQQLTWKNTPIGSTGVSLQDFDVGSAFDYDNDPDNTNDFIMADGNNSGKYVLFANRVVSNYVECGTVASGVLDLGDLSDEEMVITSARINPTMTLPAGTSITFYMSNEVPPNWQVASECTDNSSEYCVTFPKPVGRDVAWKAEMCSNSTRTETPTIDNIEIEYDYTVAQEHYRAGVVVNDGVVYAGAFRQPGDRGHFYALNAGLTDTYWDAADLLDAMDDSARNIYTTTLSGDTRLDFDVASAGSLVNTLNVGSAAQAENVVNWARSARFGVGNASIGLTKLGAVETSTPAILSPPGKPAWYNYLDTESDERTEFNQYLLDQQDRPLLALMGSKDGMVHAIRNNPTDLTDPNNGTEAWAYIPAAIAGRMITDATNKTATAYPDGSPTLADVRLTDPSTGDKRFATVALISSGNGGSSISALDVTETIDSDGSIVGPTPLWETTPGGTLAGQGYTKPAIGRVNIAGDEKFIAILATGTAFDDPTPPYTKGVQVFAVDVENGNVLWKVRTACPVTSDMLLYETDDENQDLGSAYDGFVDRAVWADYCGNVYKVDPAQDAGGAWITGFGSIDTGTDDADSNDVVAMFSTSDSTCAIGGQRPITGTIGSSPRGDGRQVLYFGTGGIESFDPTLANAFYAVYADNGEIRGTEAAAGDCTDPDVSRGVLAGSCSSGGCEKFYGGVVVTLEQVILTRAVDPPVATNTCDTGSSNVAAYDLGSFVENFSIATPSATVSSLFGDGGAIYFATLSGEIVRVGQPRVSDSGGDTANGGAPQDSGTGDGGGPNASTTMRPLSWRQVY